MMAVSEHKEELTRLYSVEEYTAEERSFIGNLYLEAFGKEVAKCNCTNRWKDAVIQLLIFSKKEETMSKYKLKRGVLAYYNGRPYNRATMTDEVAKDILEKNEKARSLFEYIPEEVANEEAPEEKVPEKEEVANEEAPEEKKKNKKK